MKFNSDKLQRLLVLANRLNDIQDEVKRAMAWFDSTGYGEDESYKVLNAAFLSLRSAQLGIEVARRNAERSA